VEFFRNYIGAHYPSDLIAGAALGAFAVWASQVFRPVSAGKKIMRWEQSSPGMFYMIAFFLSYQIATLFNDIRLTLGPVRDHILGH
jgi:undecaprenyl-diphosphatase